MKTKKSLSVLIMVVILSALIGISTLNNPVAAIKQDPLKPVWDAIYSLQSAVTTAQNIITSLQTQINTRLPQTNRITFSQAAFDNTVGYNLIFNSVNSPSGVYLTAPVQLPHGANITKLGFVMTDRVTDANARLFLLKSEPYSSGSVGVGVVSTDSPNSYTPIDKSTIINPNSIPSFTTVNNYDGGAYYLYLEIPAITGGYIQFWSAYIEYTYPA